MRPESKLQFEKAASALGLSKDETGVAWRRMTDLGLSPDDPTCVYLALGGLLERAASLPDALNALPGRIEAAAMRAVGPVADAAAIKVQAAHAELVEQTGDAVARVAERHFEASARRAYVSIGAKVAGVVVVAMLVGYFVGSMAGRADLSRLGAETAAFLSRSDAPAWLKVVAGNGDLSASIRAYCGPGSSIAYQVQGSRVCQIPLFIDGGAALAAPRGAVVAAYGSAMDWLAGFSPLWLVTGGLLAGLLGRKVLRSLVSWRPVQWLVS